MHLCFVSVCAGVGALNLSGAASTLTDDIDLDRTSQTTRQAAQAGRLRYHGILA